MRLLVTYGKRGKCIPDLTVPFWAESVVSDYNLHKQHSPDKDYELPVCTETMVLSLRVLASKGIIPYNELVFVFEGEEITVSEGGRIKKWPKGFCDIQLDMIDELLSWNNSSK